MDSDQLQRIHTKLATLFAINVFQPINKDELIKRLETNVDKTNFDSILDELIKEGRIVCEDNLFRVTYIGLKSVIRGKSRVVRDSARLQYLSDISKRRGGI
jgi:hypothetical protein